MEGALASLKRQAGSHSADKGAMLPEKGTNMSSAVEVFTPNDLPTFSYVERNQKYEQHLRQALSVPKMIVSLSGPSKSGKTVLVNKVIERDNLIPLSGATIRSPEAVWSKVLDWMEVPSETTEAKGTKFSAGIEAKGGGSVGIPLLAQGKAEGTAKLGGEMTGETKRTFRARGLQQVIAEIAHSDFIVFIDDFHYIPRELQKDIGQQIKEGAEAGVRIVTASVPHRSDDVVRSNTELRGRVTAIDTAYWQSDELEQIAYRGFRELNVDVAPAVIKQLTTESFGSPQLMQAIGLNFCFVNSINETLPEQRRIVVDETIIRNVLERTSTLTDFSSMIEVLHEGPKMRGTERKEFQFNDGTKGDVYRCVLLAMKANPPQLSFRYDDMLSRTAAECKGDSPVGSSVAQSLMQMDKLAKTVQDAPVIEWDEDVLDIVEPYFLFFLRSSTFLRRFVQAR